VNDPAVTSALYWLSRMPLVRNIAAALVVIGVAAEFLEGWISEPWRETVDCARELQMAQLSKDALRLSADAEAAKSEIAKANAVAAEATERNTQLEIRLEEERKSRIALQKALATPHLTPEQIDRLATATRGRVPFLVLQYSSDATSLALAQDIKAAFDQAAVQVNVHFAGQTIPKRYGLFIGIPTEEFRFLPDLFREFGFSPNVTVGPPMQGPTIFVGEKAPSL
jgi:hypothetical protein